MEIKLEEHPQFPGIFAKIKYPEISLAAFWISYIGSGNIGDIVNGEVTIIKGLPYMLQTGFIQSKVDIIFNSSLMCKELQSAPLDMANMEHSFECKVQKVSGSFVFIICDTSIMFEVENPSQIPYSGCIGMHDLAILKRILMLLPEQPIKVTLSDQIFVHGFQI